MTMTEPRFHAATLPEREGRWCVLDNQHPGMIRAEFPMLPDDVVSAEQLAKDTARELNARHITQMKRAQHMPTVDEWIQNLTITQLSDLADAIRLVGDEGLYAVSRRVVAQ